MKKNFKFGKYIFDSFTQFQDLQLLAEQQGLKTTVEFNKLLDEQYNKNLIKKFA